jgi:type I restriction enzyme S subunit
VTEWRWRRFSELVDNFDSGRVPIARSQRAAGRYPYYGASGIVDHVDGYLFEGDYLLISEDGENLRSRSTPIAFLATGRFWVNNHAHVVRANATSHSRFLAYALSVQDISGHITGSAQPKFSRSSLDAMQLRVPGPFTQRAIAEVLGALDDKIAVNANVVAASESLMSTAYSKLAHSGHLVPLSTTASFINGKAFTKGASDTGRLVVRIAEMNSGISNSSVYSDAIVDEEYLARPGSILFAWSGSLSVHRWFREEAIVNQHIFNVLPNPGYPNWLVFQMLQSKMASFRAIAADKATTMGHIQRHHLEALVSLPAHEQLASCDALMAASWSKALLSERESLALAALRDTLLPALMSGKLRVRDAEKAVEEVL